MNRREPSDFSIRCDPLDNVTQTKIVSPRPQTPGDGEGTGLPGLNTWRRVYVFVLGVFAVWVGLLALLTGMFS